MRPPRHSARRSGWHREGDRVPTRRDFLRAASASALAAWPLRAHVRDRPPVIAGGRLRSRPRKPTRTIGTGLISLGLVPVDDTQLFVPSAYRPDSAATLIVGLHGATQDGTFTLRILREAADAHGHLLLVPKSRGITWDMIRDDFGEDEALIDRALDWCFDRCNVDPARVVIAGFSDGASAALSLGLINGDLFRRIVAFSPGFIVGSERNGKPPVFISHGTRDEILPIDRTSRLLVPFLRRSGYTVSFHEFDGPHRAPPEMVQAAMDWLATRPAP